MCVCVCACVRACVCVCACGEGINLLRLQGIELRFPDRGTRSVDTVPKFLCESRVCVRFHADAGSGATEARTLTSHEDVAIFTCNCRCCACPVATGWGSRTWTKRSLGQRGRANVSLACLAISATSDENISFLRHELARLKIPNSTSFNDVIERSSFSAFQAEILVIRGIKCHGIAIRLQICSLQVLGSKLAQYIDLSSFTPSRVLDKSFFRTEELL
jgi:hypothetical protein